MSNQCKCLVGFFGDFCQYKDTEKAESVSYVGYFVMFITFCAVLSLISVGIYYYFNQHKLPQSVYQWLEKYAPWCIRKRGLLNLHSEESAQREVGMEEAKEEAGGRRHQRVQRSEESHQEEVIGADGSRQVVTTTTTKIQYQRSEEY